MSNKFFSKSYDSDSSDSDDDNNKEELTKSQSKLRPKTKERIRE